MTNALNRSAVALALLCLSPCAKAELLAPKIETLSSQVLHQERKIEVYLPVESGKQPTERFETLYVLDGDWNTKLVIEIVDFMRQLGMIPPIVVVSVPNYFDAHGINSRDRDLTPSVVAEEPRSGGASDFLAFLRNELIPFVDQHYPTNGVHLVHGHSYGGLFLMYVLERAPQLFDGYLVLDPAMWWDKNAFKAGLRDRLPSMPTRGKSVYIAGRAGLGAKDMGLDDLEPILKAAMPPALEWRMKLYEDETHDSLKLKATYDALKFAYGGYTQDRIDLAPDAGIMLEGQPVPLAVFGNRLNVHYTTDGSVPTADSPRYDEGPIVVSDPGKTRVRLITTRGEFDRDVPVDLKFGAPLPPSWSLASGKSGSDWHYSLYSPEQWKTNLTAMRPVKPLRQGNASQNVTLKGLGIERVAGRVERNLAIPADGYYIFGVHGSRAHLRLGNTVLIANDGPDARMQSFLVPLSKGVYKVSVDFESATEDPSLYVAVVRLTDAHTRWWAEGSPWIELKSR